MKNIQLISDNYLCSACGACASICGKDAISFKWSNIGRKYASVNQEKCVNCGLCEKVCPSIDHYKLQTRFADPFIGEIGKVYVAHAQDKNIYDNAQSGGVCTAILMYLFDQRLIESAVVCRMTSDSKPRVEGVLVTNSKDLFSCQKSCYTPVDILSALKQTEHLKSIAVVGIPCQIQGVTNLQLTSKRFNNITYKIGLICDRTLCDGIQDVMASYAGFDKITIHWREKHVAPEYGYYDYHNAPVAIISDSNEIKIAPRPARTSLKDMFTSPRCRVCYDKLNTHADIVLGDPWGMSNYNRVSGDSVIIVRTEHGGHLIEKMINSGSIVAEMQKDASEVISGQAIEKRRIKVTAYSKHLSTLVDNTISYLTNQNYSQNIHEKEISDAKHNLDSFINNDDTNLSDIIMEARKIVDKKTQKPSILKRIAVKIIKIFK
ncbi:MAG: Coenzyme F420 hydrogenase/dehydrogenase, beta subunit C-terminal domain [Bacteroidales bacterium]|nr:Coenzyme F420 hydrogenase/dehydrogenase, beta subunit C-terminal domain [Bacteroidales bacterium]